MTVERGVVHDACGGYAFWMIVENGIPAYFDADWRPITDGKCPRCRRRLLRSRLRLLDRPTVRGTGVRR